MGMGTDVSVSTFDDFEAFKKALRKEVEERARLGIGAPGELDGIMPMLPDLRGPDQFWKLAEMLSEEGHSDDRIEKFLGRNFLRLMNELMIMLTETNRLDSSRACINAIGIIMVASASPVAIPNNISHSSSIPIHPDT